MNDSRETAAKPGYKTALTIVRTLRAELLGLPEGAFIGSVTDLMTRFGISRSTMRQAVRVLEHEQLLISKRGVSGGFYVGRPRIDSIVAATATYLHSRQAGIKDFIAVARTLNIEMARLAAMCSDQERRDRLTRFLDEVWSHKFGSSTDLVRADRVLESLLADMADSPLIDLFLKVVYELGIKSSTPEQTPNTPKRIKEWQKQRRELCDAVLAGDGAAAIRIGARHYDIVQTWL
ncbi:MAG: FCD domain-containing protein [Rudaea sp.]|nr:FCD domain-containing protein [Rudaea sp.]